MGDGRDGHVGRDDGVRDAGLSGHNPHADGPARCGGRPTEGGRAPRLLSDAEIEPQQYERGCQPDRDGRVPGPFRLGREDAGPSAVFVLLRLHNHALARRRPVPEVRRQAHHGLRHTVHGLVHADDAVRGVHGIHATDHLAVRRRTRRGTAASMYK